MEEYISKQVQIRRSAEQLYTAISDLRNLTPALQDKVEEWSADELSCSFKAKGFTVGLQITEREPFKLVKIEGTQPLNFNMWIQFKEVGPYDTRMRIVLHIELNMMMRMMIGKKIQSGLDQIVDQIASSMN